MTDKALAIWQRQCQLGKLDTDNQKTIIVLPKSEGRLSVDALGEVSVGTFGSLLFSFKRGAHAFFANAANSFKLVALLALANNLLELLLLERQEGVNVANDSVGAVWVIVQDLGVAIDCGHGGAAVSDFARNVEGNIVRKTVGILLSRESVLELRLSQRLAAGKLSEVYNLLSSSLRLIPAGSALWANRVIYFV